jgi:hypothetical protein
MACANLLRYRTAMSANVRFVIMPPTWPLATTHLARSLSRGKQGESAWVAIARVNAGELEFIPRDSLRPTEISALVAEAQAHLDQQQTSWSVAAQTRGFLGFFKKPCLLSATGGADRELLGLAKQNEPRYGLTMKLAGIVVADDYAPERVLSPTALAEAHRLLGTSDLIASFPKRGMMLVGPGRPGEIPAMLQMNDAAKAIHGRAGDAAVYPYSLFVSGGKIIGVNAEGYLSLFPHDVDPWGPEW